MTSDEPAAAESARAGLRAAARTAITGPGRRLIVRGYGAALPVGDDEDETGEGGGVIAVSLAELTLGTPAGYDAVLLDLLPPPPSAEDAAGGGLPPTEAAWVAALSVGELAWAINECVAAPFWFAGVTRAIVFNRPSQPPQRVFLDLAAGTAFCTTRC